MIVATRHKSFEEQFLARFLSPISRLRRGILEGPRVGDYGLIKRNALLAIGIDGSISIVKRTSITNMKMYERMEGYLNQLLEERRLIIPGISLLYSSNC